MTRREFTQETLTILTNLAMLEAFFVNKLFASSVKNISTKWLSDLQTMCRDLKTNAITQIQWQSKINEFHNALPLEDLLPLIDYEAAIKKFRYPNLGVVTTDVRFPKIEGISGQYAFIGRIFGMQQDRAIIPHGHKNMTSCHRVLSGEVLLRQYDRVRDEGDTMFVRQTIEEIGKPGSFSSISEAKNNIHWLVANTPSAHTFDVIVVGLHEKATEIDNVDMYKAQKTDDGLLKVKKMYWEDALKKYGHSHH